MQMERIRPNKPALRPTPAVLTSILAPFLVPILALVVLIALLCFGSAAPAKAQEAVYRRAVEERFTPWLQELWQEARTRGVSRHAFEAALPHMRLDWSLPDLQPPDLGPGAPRPPDATHSIKDRPQAEFSPPAAYFPEASLKQLVARARQLEQQWGETLAGVEARFGVHRHVILAVWARETAFGNARLPHNALRALATQAYMGQRKTRFREELLLALQILEAGHINADAMASSWAGAMGHTQFMPSDFMKYAVDFDGDGREDIWNSVPDALASTANSLHKNGWETGKTWAYEVRLPRNFDCTLQGPPKARPIADWVRLGITRTFDRDFPAERASESAFLVLPAGMHGPAFLALKNFLVLKSYNFADLYAIYVGHLADRIGDNRKFEVAWRPVDRFRRDQVRKLQDEMASHGIDVGKRDGLIGAQVRASVGAYQRKLGLPADCYPNRSLMRRALGRAR